MGSGSEWLTPDTHKKRERDLRSRVTRCEEGHVRG
jgi:hypothetical protein